MTFRTCIYSFYCRELCDRCHCAFTKKDIKKHVALKSCSVVKSGEYLCPLCFEFIGPGNEADWKNHLIINGCKQIESRRRPNKNVIKVTKAKLNPKQKGRFSIFG